MSQRPDIAVPLPATPADTAVRCGVDVVSIERIERLLDEFDSSFKDRVYATIEQRYCEQQGDPPQHYAARWAVKEAFMKAVPTDALPIPFRTIAVIRPDDQPRLILNGKAETAIAMIGADGDRDGSVETAVSLSHDRHADRAIGQVVLLTDRPQ
ncbi:MAG: holo-ACP synthase [Halobacteriales archaeon]